MLSEEIEALIDGRPDYLEVPHCELEHATDMEEWFAEDVSEYMGELYIKRAYERADSIKTLRGMEPTRCLDKLGIGVGTYPSGTHLEDLHGLESLEWVLGNLSLGDSPQLTNIEGLRSLRGTGGNLLVASCDAITSLESLARMQTIQGDLIIKKNARLSSLGLENLRAVEGDRIVIRDNPMLPIEEVETLLERLLQAGFAGGFDIQGNLGLAEGPSERETPPIKPAENLTVERWDQDPSTATLKTDRSASHWPFGDDYADAMHTLNPVYTEEFIRQAWALCQEHAETLPEAERDAFLSEQRERLEGYRR